MFRATRPRQPRIRKWSRHIASVLGSAGVASIALLAAGCGSSSPGSSTQSRLSPTGHSLAHDAYAFSRCIRDRGLTTFPDLTVRSDANGQNPVAVPAQYLHSPAFKSAATACGRLLPEVGAPAGPGGGPAESAQAGYAREQTILAFARCMRAQGVTKFPDPTPQGQLTAEMVVALGIDLHSRSVLRAVAACLPTTHGLLTVADVRRAIASVP
jgi:hypothetical protein